MLFALVTFVVGFAAGILFITVFQEDSSDSDMYSSFASRYADSIHKHEKDKSSTDEREK